MPLALPEPSARVLVGATVGALILGLVVVAVRPPDAASLARRQGEAWATINAAGQPLAALEEARATVVAAAADLDAAQIAAAEAQARLDAALAALPAAEARADAARAALAAVADVQLPADLAASPQVARVRELLGLVDAVEP